MLDSDNFKLITIDGPSASGKSSVSCQLARRLGWNWVSTGVFYRGLALLLLDNKIDLGNEGEILSWLESPAFEVRMASEQTHLMISGVDRTHEIHGESIGAAASQVSSHPKVRRALLQLQRDCLTQAGLVAEGRDCGTVVFPQARLKVYLTARAEKRAQRRSIESQASVDKTLDQQKKRDFEDSNRKSAPLERAEGAFVIDSSELSLDEVVRLIEAEAQTRIPELSF